MGNIAPERLKARAQSRNGERIVELYLWPKSLHFVGGGEDGVNPFECR